MASRIKTLPVRIESISPQTSQTQGEVSIEEWGNQERARRAVRILALCWGGAAVSVFIPLLHFVLVPLLALAGPIIAGIVYGQKDVVLGGQGQCPNCGKQLEIVRGSLRWPLSELCPHCQTESKIHPIELDSVTQ